MRRTKLTNANIYDPILEACFDKKAQNTIVLEVGHLVSYTDTVVVCSGQSERQVRALADSIRRSMKNAGHHLLGMEGQSEGQWILIDFGDVVVHIFYEPLREYYDLEHLWAGAKRIKIDESKYLTTPVTASAQ